MMREIKETDHRECSLRGSVGRFDSRVADDSVQQLTSVDRPGEPTKFLTQQSVRSPGTSHTASHASAQEGRGISALREDSRNARGATRARLAAGKTDSAAGDCRAWGLTSALSYTVSTLGSYCSFFAYSSQTHPGEKFKQARRRFIELISKVQEDWVEARMAMAQVRKLSESLHSVRVTPEPVAVDVESSAAVPRSSGGGSGPVFRDSCHGMSDEEKAKFAEAKFASDVVNELMETYPEVPDSFKGFSASEIDELARSLGEHHHRFLEALEPVVRIYNERLSAAAVERDASMLLRS